MNQLNEKYQIIILSIILFVVIIVVIILNNLNTSNNQKPSLNFNTTNQIMSNEIKEKSKEERYTENDLQYMREVDNQIQYEYEGGFTKEDLSNLTNNN